MDQMEYVMLFPTYFCSFCSFFHILHYNTFDKKKKIPNLLIFDGKRLLFQKNLRNGDHHFLKNKKQNPLKIVEKLRNGTG